MPKFEAKKTTSENAFIIGFFKVFLGQKICWGVEISLTPLGNTQPCKIYVQVGKIYVQVKLCSGKIRVQVKIFVQVKYMFR